MAIIIQEQFVVKSKPLMAQPEGINALVWLNLYGCEAVLHKLKNRQKVHFLWF